MELRTITINKDRYLFINESLSTRNGFKHTTKLFLNSIFLNESTCYYINRTWECYTYQSVMYKCINELIDNRTEKLKDKFKDINNINRITEKHKKELNKYIKSDSTIKRLNKIKELLKDRI